MTSWRRRTSRMRHRHYGFRLQAIAVVFVICALAVTAGTPLGIAVAFPGQVLFGTSALVQLRHLFGPPCTECARAMPLNPAESAQGNRGSRWALRAAHGVFASLAAWGVALLVLLALSFRPLYGAIGMGGAAWAANWFLSLSLGLMLAANWVTRTHNRLLPWCPYCPDDEGDGDESPTPTPTDGRDQPVPA